MQKITNSEKATFDFAKNYAKKLKGGEIIGLVGDLGAGKTIFAKGLAKGLGVKQTVASPTFVLMKIYPITSHKLQAASLVHIDAYRISGEKDLLSLGIEEYFDDNGIVMLIEWADKIKRILPQKTRFIRISNKEKNKRIIEFY